MRIALIGSWKPGARNKKEDRPKLRDQEHFAEACRDLARTITQAGHQIVVGSESGRTADFHAVEGVISVFEQSPSQFDVKPIAIVRPRDREMVFEEWRRRYDIFTEYRAPASQWSVAKLFQVKDADRAIIVGGADLSYQAGLAAAVSGKRVVPIGSFGGAGEQLIDFFASSRNCWPHTTMPSQGELGELRSPWSPHQLQKVIGLLHLSPQILLVHGHSPDWTRLKAYLEKDLRLPEPVVMKEEFAAGLTLPEKFENLAEQVNAAIALVTPDDVGYLSSSEGTLQRARQNVWVETGWFWGKLGRRRVLLLRKGNAGIPSDLQGLEFAEYESDPLEQQDKINLFVKNCARGRA